ncbi:MAG TPA: hypothetical protein VEQ63_16175, partial [Bryobacteraceae bacterium]|nr:hypothetical protein [Bryobacteraceae bacterium]
QVDFGGEQAVTGVDVYWAEEPQISVRVEIEVTPGQWKQVSDRPQSLEAPPMEGARHLPTRVLNSYGITHLAVEKSNPLWQDMVTNQREWGVSLAGETATLRLYAIEQRE